MQKANPIKLKPTPKPFNGNPNKKTSITEQISSKMTSPTLVEFRSQNAQMPEWRLQLQNAVQKRMKSDADRDAPERPVSVAAPAAEALPASAPSPEVEPKGVKSSIDNKHLSNALKRIESSRNRYLIVEPEIQNTVVVDGAQKKDYPFTIASRTENPSPDSVETTTTPAVPQVKPKLVSGKKKKKLIKDLYNTSELDPDFPPARLSSSFSSRPAAEPTPKPTVSNRSEPVDEPEAKADVKFSPGVEEKKVEVRTPEKPESRIEEPKKEQNPKAEAPDAETENMAVVDEFDDYAPFSLRFNAGFFDLLIGSFLSFVLLLPFIAAGGNWFTVSGLLAFVATCSIVMFIYLTASVGLAGKSFGMHLFSLEVIDIGGETYPSLHQSAVSSIVYLISTACLGLGFITALFDDDRRAAHDLLSGTLVVREL